jgi:molecular chaperone DnaK
MDRDRAIGIDLGTTYTCAAVVEDGKPRVIRSRLGYTTIPSVVTYDDQGEALVGQPAERRMIVQPEETIYGSKRLVGRAFASGVRKRFQPFFQYELVSDQDGFIAAKIGERTISLVDVSALILREIRAAAESGLGERIRRAVITVPAYFNENQRASVREAGKRAELDVIRIINEPTAAALCFGINQQDKKRVLVFDLGGGTFDVSIVNIEAGLFSVLGVDGDSFLGGIDFDRRIVTWLLARLEEREGKPVEVSATAKERLRGAAQDAKHQLSVQKQALINLPNLELESGATVNINDMLSRDEFEEITSELVEQTLAVVRRALDRQRIRPSDIDDILLVGGQTRMPALHARLKEIFGKEPTKKVHPDEVVALGAAIAADSHVRMQAVKLVDVVPLPIGLGSTDGKFVPVIPRNTAVPHESSTTVFFPGNCRTLELAVFQGDRSHSFDNEYLGSIHVDGLNSDSDEDVETKVGFFLDEESLLTVHVSIPALNLDQEVDLVTTHTPDEVLARMGKERIRVVAPDRGRAKVPSGDLFSLVDKLADPEKPKQAADKPKVKRPMGRTTARLEVVKRDNWFKRFLGWFRKS